LLAIPVTHKYKLQIANLKTVNTYNTVRVYTAKNDLKDLNVSNVTRGNTIPYVIGMITKKLLQTLNPLVLAYNLYECP